MVLVKAIEVPTANGANNKLHLISVALKMRALSRVLWAYCNYLTWLQMLYRSDGDQVALDGTFAGFSRLKVKKLRIGAGIRGTHMSWISKATINFDSICPGFYHP